MGLSEAGKPWTSLLLLIGVLFHHEVQKQALLLMAFFPQFINPSLTVYKTCLIYSPSLSSNTPIRHEATIDPIAPFQNLPLCKAAAAIICGVCCQLCQCKNRTRMISYQWSDTKHSHTLQLSAVAVFSMVAVLLGSLLFCVD